MLKLKWHTIAVSFIYTRPLIFLLPRSFLSPLHISQFLSVTHRASIALFCFVVDLNRPIDPRGGGSAERGVGGD